ncbi:TonB-dependent siderophore receptor [Rhizobium sp. S153]|uniref:TonB-dependent siderophore receptor n=1 Tax=Ciceribacter sichuanensis TaxID=2949647 RepID=A0ABT0VB86_9HYPH|nr:TonB-dependent siderophore receptor [Ciceribacter sp. S153]MCM2403096.1 TonB-dependent siderophore receptor [Ciceribacter sp. S153]
MTNKGKDAIQQNAARRSRGLSGLALIATTSLIAFGAAQAQDADDGSTQLETIVIQGAGSEKGDGPVKGYVAKQSRAGTKTDTALSKTPQSVSVVPAEQIADQDAQSVAEAMRYSAGVFAEYRGPSNLHDEMFIRGYYYVPRFVNGLLYGNNSLGQIDPWLLERVEVVRGPSSILYGQANPGGIVNLVTKRPTDDPLHEVEVGFGTGDRASVSFDFSDALPGNEDIRYRLAGTAWRADTQEDFLEQKRISLAPSVTWTPDEQTSLTIEAFYQNDPEAGFRNFLEAAGTVDETAYGYVPTDFLVSDPDYQESTRKQAYIGYAFEHEFENDITFRQNMRYSMIDQTYNTLTWNSMQADEKTVTRSASDQTQLQHQFVIDNQIQAKVDTGPLSHTLLGGVDYRFTTEDNLVSRGTANSIDWTNPSYGNVTVTGRRTSTDATTDASQVGVYLQDQIEFGKLNVMAGLRYDWADTDVDDKTSSNTDASYDDQEFTWRAGAIYDLGYGISPYASYSTSFEPVTQSPGAGQDPFDATTAQQYEVGVKFAPEGENYQVTASYYDLTQQNVLFYDNATSLYYQTGEIVSKGFEIEAHAEITDNLKLVASYSHINQEVTETVRSAELGKMPARVPIDQASLWAKYEFLDGPLAGLGIGGGVRFLGESWGNATNTFKVDPTTLFDASLSYDFAAKFPDMKGLKLQVNASNLADEKYVASCASATACFYGSRRSVTASLKYTW